MIDIKHIAEGVHHSVGVLQAAIGNNRPNLPPIFQQWIVLETIADPYSFSQKNLEDFESKYSLVRNRELAINGRILPRNTIIAHPPKNQYNPIQNPMFLYPLLPSSIALPCRPGEHVWVVFEIIQPENQARDTLSERAYWLCSVVQEGHVEDVNHSHRARSDDAEFLKSNSYINNGQLQPGGASAAQKAKGFKVRYHFKNGKYLNPDALDYTYADLIPGNVPLNGNEYEDVLRNSEGSKSSVYEAVPRFKKRPGDIALEGSNNTLIVLGRDRTGPVSGSDINKKKAGSIDLVAGRGQTPKTGGNVVTNDLGNEELAKDGSSLVLNEGDPDFKNDKSRIYISQKTKVDENFGLKTNNSTLKKNPINDSADGDPGIVIKSDKVRIIARSDLQIIVTNNVSEGEDDPKKFASITVKSNGDIVFKPSDMGYIKLGGDDADRGIVCSAFPVNTTNGGIEGGQLLTSAGGLFAGSTFATPDCNQPIPLPGPTAGTFANKVLIK
jgi:hypothetical protein